MTTDAQIGPESKVALRWTIAACVAAAAATLLYADLRGTVNVHVTRMEAIMSDVKEEIVSLGKGLDRINDGGLRRSEFALWIELTRSRLRVVDPKFADAVPDAPPR